MDLTCILCHATVTLPVVGAVVAENGTPPRPKPRQTRHFPRDGDAAAAVQAETSAAAPQLDAQNVTRCVGCGGYFHSPCLDAGAVDAAVPFVCHDCRPREADDGGSGVTHGPADASSTRMPLLLPAHAAQFLSVDDDSANDTESDDDLFTCAVKVEVGGDDDVKMEQQERTEEGDGDKEQGAAEDRADEALKIDEGAERESDTRTADVVPGSAPMMEEAKETAMTSDTVKIKVDPVALVAENTPGAPSSEETPANATQTAPTGALPVMETVTILICDGCDAEYEVGPTFEVPEGDWFCLYCQPNVKGKSKDRSKSSRKKASKGSKSKKKTAAPIATPLEAVPTDPHMPIKTQGLPPLINITLLICDGCDGEFDVAALDPPLGEIPEGDWFCGPCAQKRESAATPKRKRSQRNTADAAKTAVQAIGLMRCGSCQTDVNTKQSFHVDDEWLCRRCATTSNRKSSRQSKNSKKGDSVSSNNDDPADLAAETNDGELVAETPTSSAASRGRKRKRGGFQKKDKTVPVVVAESAGADKADQLSKGSREKEAIGFLPLPVTAAAMKKDEKGSDNFVQSDSVVVLSDEELGDDDDEEIILICDLCLSELKMVDIMPDVKEPPPRPWFCKPCMKSLKRNRKSSKRLTRHMVLEIEIHGSLVRHTAAKVLSSEELALRGRKPILVKEIRQLITLVGKRVGIFLRWDKHWVMGRVLRFDPISAEHTVQFEDDSEHQLPLYAFPVVIGTDRLMYVKVPAMHNWWWPAQLLRMNALARKMLLKTLEEEENAAAFHLVSIFAGGSHPGKTHNISCWVPKHLCRSLERFNPPQPTIEDSNAQRQAGAFSQATQRADRECEAEQRTLQHAFAELINEHKEESQWHQFAVAVVGKDLVLEAGLPSARTVRVSDYDAATSTHRVTFGDSSFSVDLRECCGSVGVPSSEIFASIAVDAYRSIGTIEDIETKCKTIIDKGQDPQTAKQKLAASSSPPVVEAPVVPMKHCATCLLEATSPDSSPSFGRQQHLVQCVKCESTYHPCCSDPPSGPFALINQEDGAILLEDTKPPFVCSDCVTCAGCGSSSPTTAPVLTENGSDVQQASWYNWRLPLQPVALCDSCEPQYEEHAYCPVCCKTFSDDDYACTSDLLRCSTCLLWVHGDCEPDPHPALHQQRNGGDGDFALDFHIDLPENPAISTETSDNMASDSEKPEVDDEALVPSASGDGSSKVEFKPARLVDEERAGKLKFRSAYDPKVLHKYECWTCRKVRMLRVLHRLFVEDKLELFKEPVTKTIAPTYFEVIKCPMDLTSMQRKVLSGDYKFCDFRGLREDFELLCLNAVTFNTKERDFLIWREAWRFYGQGQKVFRQEAPKSRIKHPGGKYYDALVLAAKRQLPNNSVIGKKSLSHELAGTDAPNNGDDDDMEAFLDRQVDDDAEASSDVQKVDKPAELKDAQGVLANEIVPVNAARSSSETPAVAPSVSAAPTATAAPTSERKRMLGPFEFQTELSDRPLPETQLTLFVALQTRASAHTYCWLDMCTLCGSAGSKKMLLFCVDCGEGFHTFCVGVPDVRLEKDSNLQTYWRCPNCKMCEICGKPPSGDDDASRLHVCGCCERAFHGSCLAPAIQPATTDEGDEVQTQSQQLYCAQCVKCRVCEQSLHDTSYSFSPDLCLTCCHSKQNEDSLVEEKKAALNRIWTADARKMRKDAEKCPMCRQKWDAENEELIQCDACELWGHPNCDTMLTEEPLKYKKLVEDPNTLYVCGECRPKNREHLAGVQGIWKSQVLLAKIQEKRRQCDAKWAELQDQIREARKWRRWREHTPVYLYVLRLGEECLKSMAFRSLNFQTNWMRYPKEKELDAGLPHWLVQKANRYVRFKRYARGPRASLRRLQRKKDNFYSQQGIEQQEISSICTIVSEAAGCAAFLACVHLLYGWRPLPKSVVHLLSADDPTRKLPESLVKMLISSDEMSLEEEVALIRKQYERRVGKRHLLRDDQDPQGENTSEVADAESPVPNALGESPALEPATPKTPSRTPRTPRTPRQDVRLTIAEPLHGWSIPGVSDDAQAVAQAAATSQENGGSIDQTVAIVPTTSASRDRFCDNRYCMLCLMIGDETLCGRLLYLELDTWVHVNCILWSSDVFESEDGVLMKCQRAKNRGRMNLCDACGIIGASVGCSYSRCMKHYHFPCALDNGVVFLENGDTCCPNPAHIESVTKKLLKTKAGEGEVQTNFEHIDNEQPVATTPEDPGAQPGKAEQAQTADNDAQDIKPDEHIKEEPRVESDLVEGVSDPTVPVVGPVEPQVVKEEEHGGCDTKPVPDGQTIADQEKSVAPAAPAMTVPSSIIPSYEQSRHLQTDLATADLDPKRRVQSLKLKRHLCYRIGALTIHALGHIVPGNPSFHSPDAIYPLGFRSTRIFWSTQTVEKRCVYECVISSTQIEERARRKQLCGVEEEKTDEGDTKRKEPTRAVFKITPSDDRDHPIVASSPNGALVQLRSRVVALYEDHRCFPADRNPFLARSSWFSFGLTGNHFFGVAIPVIAEELEQLPGAATTAISRKYMVNLHRQTRKRRKLYDASASSDMPLIDNDTSDVYKFHHVLPSAQEMEAARKQVEELVAADERARLSTGSIRTDGFQSTRIQVVKSKAHRRLNKDASKETEIPASSSNSTAAGAAGASGGGNTGAGGTKGNVAMDLEHLPIAMQYRELRRRPFDEKLEVRKSKIHGWGLFTKEQFTEGQMIVEYQGEMISQAVADERERYYEEIGIGSCYMFRLDASTIIDATRTGNLARFINHSCDPKAFARVVSVEGNDKKIVIFAKRTIEAGDEVTYDYKFPIEDEAIRCDCSAPNCIGRMN